MCLVKLFQTSSRAALLSVFSCPFLGCIVVCLFDFAFLVLAVCFWFFALFCLDSCFLENSNLLSLSLRAHAYVFVRLSTLRYVPMY